MYERRRGNIYRRPVGHPKHPWEGVGEGERGRGAMGRPTQAVRPFLFLLSPSSPFLPPAPATMTVFYWGNWGPGGEAGDREEGTGGEVEKGTVAREKNTYDPHIREAQGSVYKRICSHPIRSLSGVVLFRSSSLLRCLLLRAIKKHGFPSRLYRRL